MKKKLVILFAIYGLLIGCALTLNGAISKKEIIAAQNTAPSEIDARDAWLNLELYKNWAIAMAKKGKRSEDQMKDLETIQKKAQEALDESKKTLEASNRYNASWKLDSLQELKTQFNSNQRVALWTTKGGVKEILRDIVERKKIIMNYASS